MKLSDTQVKDLAQPLVGIIEDFYKNPDNEKGFQQWLEEKSKTQS